MFKKTLLTLTLSSMALVSLPSFAANYAIDAEGAHASINFSVKHLGYSLLTGRFDTFGGSFSYDPAKPEESSVKVTIETNSVNSNHAARDKHLRSDDFLNVEKFPQATFVSTQVVVDPKNKESFSLKGDLTLNGVTKNISINVDKIGEGKDPWGGYRAGFHGETEINMRDFNIKMNLGPASQTVKLELNVEGIKQQ